MDEYNIHILQNLCAVPTQDVFSRQLITDEDVLKSESHSYIDQMAEIN